MGALVDGAAGLTARIADQARRGGRLVLRTDPEVAGVGLRHGRRHHDVLLGDELLARRVRVAAGGERQGGGNDENGTNDHGRISQLPLVALPYIYTL